MAARIKAVVPSFTNVCTSDMLASPMMTWNRRYREGSPWGSSLVLMMGLLSVVSRPTSSSKKSARWLIWYRAGGRPFSEPSFPDPVKIWRVTSQVVA